MGSHSKKRKKDKKRSRSRSRSSERYRSSRRRSRSPSRSRSRSPSYSTSKKKKHHKRSKSRSRSRSRSRERYSYSKRSSRSRSRDRSSRRSSRSRSCDRSSRRSSRSRSRDRSSRRSSHSRSRDRERSSKYRRSRSRSRSADRRRRRSRSSDRRSKRSRSKEKEKSPERPSVGASQDSTQVKIEESIKEEDDLKLNPAEAIHHKMRKALEAAASADAKLREQGLLSNIKQEPLSRTEQLEREQVLQNLESDSFVPSSFVSSRERQAQPSYLTTEQTHENAIFGGAGVSNPALNGGQTYSYGIPIKYKKRGQLASKYLSESAEVKERRWLEKLQAMRKQKMEANPEYFNRLLTINADSPSRD